MFNNYKMKMTFGNLALQEPISNKNMTLTSTVNNIPTTREMPWAQPTWLLFHTLAEKVDEERFLEIKSGLLNIIYTIVTILPCPICAKHGKTFLDGVNFNTIVNKEQLKFLIFDFHNAVNKKNQSPAFLYGDLDKYQNTITITVIQHFMHHFTKGTGSIRLISDDLHRQRVNIELKKWFNDNIMLFSR